MKFVFPTAGSLHISSLLLFTMSSVYQMHSRVESQQSQQMQVWRWWDLIEPTGPKENKQEPLI